ncbi:hypothetical protein AACH10_02935 [Ideonella sp. DXS22W]|uniref:Glycosyltransferase family 2 protein n=1 Tax=Pseudaquabacterium inlustre TaxID=2984192 RepID=A0ABU9CFU6_9BURK
MQSTPLRFAISATAHNRPDRLERLLASVADAAGSAQWPMYISIEPTPVQDQILAVIERYRTRLTLQARVNAERKGVRRNPFDNVEWVLSEGADTVLLLEDDLLIDHQALRWCEGMADGPLQQPGVMAANLLTTTCNSESIFVPDAGERARLAGLVLRTRFFSSYGLLFTRQQWAAHFRDNWFVDAPLMENWEGRQVTGWDVAMTRWLLCRPELSVLQSLVPRVMHDGAGGTHISDAFQDRSFGNIAFDAAADDATGLPALRVIDALADLDQVPSAAARMYLNLARHLWTLQQHSLAFKHTVPDLAGLKQKRFRLGAHEYLVFRRRRPK